MGSISTLKYFGVWGNKMTGTIPTEVENLLDLEFLYLQQNDSE